MSGTIYKQNFDLYMIHPTYIDANSVMQAAPRAYRKHKNLSKQYQEV